MSDQYYDDPDLANDIAEIEKFDANRIDFQVLNAGSIFVLTPLTPADLADSC